MYACHTSTVIAQSYSGNIAVLTLTVVGFAYMYADQASKMRRWNKIIYNRDASIAPRLINLGAQKAAVKLTDSKTGEAFYCTKKQLAMILSYRDIYVRFRGKLQFSKIGWSCQKFILITFN